MAAIAAILTALMTVINIGLAIRTIVRDRQNRNTPKPHPLEYVLLLIHQAQKDSIAAQREIAAAIYETRSQQP